MRPLTTLAAFALVLVASFGAGAALGAALPDLGPSSSDPPTAPAEPAPPGGHQP
jgi:hypothetical protein